MHALRSYAGPAAPTQAWASAVAASRQLAGGFADWLAKPDPARVAAL